MLDAVKKDLRISHDKLDDDIQSNIEVALKLTEVAGVIPDRSDTLIIRLVKDYCRWKYNFEGEGERYRVAFEDLLGTLSMSQEHKL